MKRPFFLYRDQEGELDASGAGSRGFQSGKEAEDFLLATLDQGIPGFLRWPVFRKRITGPFPSPLRSLRLRVMLSSQHEHHAEAQGSQRGNADEQDLPS